MSIDETMRSNPHTHSMQSVFVRVSVYVSRLGGYYV